MRLGRRQAKQDEAQVDLTPMLDIVFIMLIFFIVTSSFVRESGIDVDRPQASHVVNKKEAGIFVAITASNEIFLDKQRVDVERVQARLEALLLNSTSRSLVIQADEKALNGVVVKVMDAARGAGITQIALAAEKP
ncbi:TonB system transport protein ExbD2 [Vibrio sinaloensis DSM 21326]|uniref:TonB system transport protein ExbD2 n=1 Tax=Vibrio sinaloensis DSM 21326 TaxID=945550 RepID=E8M707_PHOS4|nr:biopolymer transporter ExbD [Vibrio sinaloensis]EGA70206.1 TonB system transport protein ExbD2 [Vibrio sinaloensis DSM 21326]